MLLQEVKMKLATTVRKKTSFNAVAFHHAATGLLQKPEGSLSSEDKHKLVCILIFSEFTLELQRAIAISQVDYVQAVYVRDEAVLRTLVAQFLTCLETAYHIFSLPEFTSVVVVRGASS